MKTIIISITLVVAALTGCGGADPQVDYRALAQNDWDALDQNTQSTYCNTLSALGSAAYLKAALEEGRFSEEHVLARFDVVMRECHA